MGRPPCCVPDERFAPKCQTSPSCGRKASARRKNPVGLKIARQPVNLPIAVADRLKAAAPVDFGWLRPAGLQPPVTRFRQRALARRAVSPVCKVLAAAPRCATRLDGRRNVGFARQAGLRSFLRARILLGFYFAA